MARSASDIDAIEAILGSVLGAPGALDRRREAMGADANDPAALKLAYAELDALVDFLCRRLGEALRTEEEQARARK